MTTEITEIPEILELHKNYTGNKLELEFILETHTVFSNILKVLFCFVFIVFHQFHYSLYSRK